MIQYFKTFGPGFSEPAIERLGQLLLSDDPAKRPSLTDQPWWIEQGPVARRDRKEMGPASQKGRDNSMLMMKKRAAGQGAGKCGIVGDGRRQQSKVGKVKGAVHDQKELRPWFDFDFVPAF